MTTSPKGVEPPTARPRDEQELALLIRDHFSRKAPLRAIGGGTRTAWIPDCDAVHVETAELSGVVDYEPGALTLVVRAGTPLEDVEKLLASEGQGLAFEPMDHRFVLGSSGTPTVGGMVAANVSGPRRIQTGACRDYVLGVRFVDGQGRLIRNGGRVMKNVTGLDLGKLLCGSRGTLGVLTEVALKTLPLAECTTTLQISDVDAAEASQIFMAAMSTPYEVSGAVFHRDKAWIRIEGFEAQVSYRLDRLKHVIGSHSLDILPAAGSMRLWRRLRDLEHLGSSPDPLWRILIRPSEAGHVAAALRPISSDLSLDWGGALIWCASSHSIDDLRAAVSSRGSVSLVRGPNAVVAASTAEDTAVAALTAAVARAFDPAGILSPKQTGN